MNTPSWHPDALGTDNYLLYNVHHSKKMKTSILHAWAPKNTPWTRACQWTCFTDLIAWPARSDRPDLLPRNEVWLWNDLSLYPLFSPLQIFLGSLDLKWEDLGPVFNLMGRLRCGLLDLKWKCLNPGSVFWACKCRTIQVHAYWAQIQTIDIVAFGMTSLQENRAHASVSKTFIIVWPSVDVGSWMQH